MNVKNVDEGIRVLFKKREDIKIPKELAEKFELSIVAEELVRTTVINNSMPEEKWQFISDLADNSEYPEILLVGSYVVEFDESEDSFDLVNQLFIPNFDSKGFCVSKMHFFIDKEYTYSIELDYGFENTLDIEISHFISNTEEVSRCIAEFGLVLDDICLGLKEK